MTVIDIKQLIIEAKNGDNSAFEKIYSEYLTPIYRYIYFRIGDRDMADDLVQEVFLKVFESLNNFEINESSPLSYFYTVARNLLTDTYRKKKFTIVKEEAIKKVSAKDNLEKQAILKDDSESLISAIAKISRDKADVLILKFVKDYSNKEISQILGKSEEAVRQLQSRGIEALRSVLNKNIFYK